MVDYLCKDEDILLQFYQALVAIGRLGQPSPGKNMNSQILVSMFRFIPWDLYHFRNRRIFRWETDYTQSGMKIIQTKVPLTFAFNQSPEGTDTQQSLYINKADPIRLRSFWGHIRLRNPLHFVDLSNNFLKLLNVKVFDQLCPISDRDSADTGKSSNMNWPERSWPGPSGGLFSASILFQWGFLVNIVFWNGVVMKTVEDLIMIIIAIFRGKLERDHG